jgi:hypothetical protein
MRLSSQQLTDLPAILSNYRGQARSLKQIHILYLQLACQPKLQ